MYESKEFPSVNKKTQDLKSNSAVLLDPHLKDECGRNTLLQAAFQGDLEEVKRLLVNKELYIQDSDGNTALHLASLQGHENIIAYLIDKVSPKVFLTRNNRNQVAFQIMRENGLINSVLKFQKKLRMISNRSIDYEDIISLRNAVQSGLGQCTLTTLDLSGSGITDNLFTPLLADLENNQSLTHLSLQQNLLTAKAMGPLSEWLKKDIKLKVLNLDGNKIGSSFFLFSGVRDISNALKKNQTLQTLTLANCQLHDADVNILTSMLKQNSALRELRVDSNLDITLEVLQKMLVSLSIHPHGLKNLVVNEYYHSMLKDNLLQALNSTPLLETYSTPVEDSDLFLKLLNDLSPELTADAERMDEETKNKLLKKRDAKLLTKKERLDLFRELVREQRVTYLQSKSIIKDKVAYFQIQEELQWLTQQDQKYIPAKASWDKQGERLAYLEEETPKHANTRKQQYKASLERRFETILQRKLSIYWLAANCLETKLLSAAKDEVEQTLKRLNIILGLLSLLPLISETHHVAHGLLGMFEKVYEFLHEVMESMHFVEFVSELPIVHQGYHHFAKKLSQLKTITEEQMLENIVQGFSDWEMCTETCQSIAKAITHRYECLIKLDSLEDADKLAEFTSSMILDFYKMGGYKEIQDQGELVNVILDWLFYSSEFYYKNKKQPVLLIEGQRHKITEFYSKASLVCNATDQDQEPITVHFDISIQDKDNQEMIRTNSPILKRKASKKEVSEFSRYLETQREKVQKEPTSKRKTELLKIEFIPREDFCLTATNFQVVEFTFKTKSQRLKELEEGIEVLKEEVAGGKLKANTLEDEVRKLIKKREIDKELLEKYREQITEFTKFKIDFDSFKPFLEKLKQEQGHDNSQTETTIIPSLIEAVNTQGIFSSGHKIKRSHLKDEKNTSSEKQEVQFN